MNKVFFAGYLGRNLELRKTKNGHSLVDFSLGITEKNDQTIWVKFKAIGKIAENIAKYCQKGDLLMIEGKFRPYKIENFHQYYIFVNSVVFNTKGNKLEKVALAEDAENRLIDEFEREMNELDNMQTTDNSQ